MRGAAEDLALVDPGDVLLALQSAMKKYGLSLESSKGQGAYFVIVSLERPSAN